VVDAAKASMFDTLYLLYLLRRSLAVNLDDLLGGLRLPRSLAAAASHPRRIRW
jgi:hypothetical protein